MTTRTSYYGAKFDSAQAEIIHRKSLDTSFLDDEFGETDQYGLHAALIRGLYGADWIVYTETSGKVDVDRFPRPPEHRSFECEAHWGELANRYYTWAAEDDEDYDIDEAVAELFNRSGDR